MDKSINTGVSFGLTSGIITTLGLMVGLSAAANSKSVMVGGILTIAIADAFSDALGIHVSQESQNEHTPKEIWMATLATMITKFIMAASFIIPVLLLSLEIAIPVSIFYGLFVLGIFSYRIGIKEKKNPLFVIFEHIFIAIIVIALTNFVGGQINSLLG